MLQAGGDAIQAHVLWQGECAAEFEGGALLAQQLCTRLVLQLPLAADEQGSIYHLHLQVRLRQAGHICSQGTHRGQLVGA